MSFGLKDSELCLLQELFAANERISKVILYGSRAKGNYKPFSDVDITLVGEGLSRRDLNEFLTRLDESSLPYIFDVSIFEKLNNPELIDHINRRGVEIYSKQES